MTDTIGFELSSQQQAEWLRHAGASPSPVVCIFELPGPPDVIAVRERLALAAQRHEILRTTFSRPAGHRFPLQVVASESDRPAVEECELAEGPQALDHLERELLATSFDPERGLLVRVIVARQGAQRAALGLAGSGLVLDGESLLALGLELLGGPADDEPLQYGDYAAWQAELLEETPPAPHPDASPPTALPLLAGGDERHRVPVALAASLAGDLGAFGPDPRDAWLAAWVALVGRLTGQDEVAMAVTVGARASEELEGAVGPYARSVPVTIEVAAGITFTALVDRVHVARRDAEASQEQLGAVPADPPLGFAYTPAPVTPSALTVTDVRRAPAPLNGQARLDVVAGEGAATATLLTSGGDSEEAGRIARSFERLAHSAVLAPDTDVWELDVLAAADRARLLAEFGQGPKRPPAALVHERFAECVARTPDAPAVASAGAAVSYAELADRSAAIAAALRARAVAGGVVALLFDRTSDIVAAVLGVLRVGAAYLPLDPDQPEARLAFQVQDAGARLILSRDGLEGKAAAMGAEVLGISAALAGAGASGGAGADSPVHVGPDDLAYLIYTSGSTGTPKGVEVTHGNLANYVDAILDRLGPGVAAQPLRFGAVTTLSTDLGNTSVFPALASGGCVEILPADAVMDGAAYASYVATRPVDILKITPSHLAALVASGGPGVLPRRSLVLGGEAAPWTLIDAVRAGCDCEILNHYGPTETTVGSVVNAVGERAGAQAFAATVPIGHPLANTTVAVVDDRLQLVPLGAPGELLIGGAGVARGYRNQPEQTAQRFITDPVQGEPGSRVYRTGDRVRMLADGSLEFLHRVDGQLKIRGFRVEVAEVEAALSEHPAVGSIAVVPHEPRPGELRLVAYAVPAAGAKIDGEILRELARKRLPEYMVPSAVVALDALPLMPNGKLDRSALPAPEEPLASSEYVAPSRLTEQRIADIWAEALGVERVGIRDDFFELGGHSLLATQVIARIRTSFGVQLPLHALFTAPRVAELAAEVERLLGAGDAELQDLLTELEGLSDEEAERLLGAG